MKKNTLMLIGLVIVAAVCIFLAFKKNPSPATVAPGTACTDEAKICPDGSVVGRTGPLCEFRACPTTNTDTATPGDSVFTTDGWKTSTDTKQQLSFKYPDPFPATYVSAQTWPPKVTLSSKAFSCAAPLTVHGNTYCMTQSSEGAAGSTYTTYRYTTAHDAGLITIDFTLRFVQCGNYDEPKQSACKTEQAALSVSGLADTIASSLALTPGSVASRTSGINGSATVGPTCPVVHMDANGNPDPACADKPFAGNFIAINVATGRTANHFSSGSDGIFTVTLSPGQYRISQRSSAASANGQGSYPRCPDSDTLTVTAESFTHTTIACDSGIR